MPPTPLATPPQSREKLKQFQFAKISAEIEPDKENFNSHPSLQDSRCDAPKTLPYTSENTQPKSQNICPHTPASKIPLAALIGNTEDALNGVNFDTTPEDHVSWQHGPRSSDPASSSRSTQRGKKRARSSSPASSSQIEKSNHFSGQKEPLDLQNLQQSLKTPQHDPATDLWARYSTAGLAKANGDNAALPPFAQLITSSPQTPNTINSRESGLQRSISCGIEWPTSRKKRRKLDTVDKCGRIRDHFESSNQDDFSNQETGRSRVELLVGMIKDSMQRRQSVLVRGPSSSSPLPDRADVLMHRNGSPSPKKRAQEGLSAPDARPKQGSHILGTSKLNHDCIAEDDSSSEFGDADLDLNFLETIEMTGTQMMSEKELINCEAQNSPMAMNVPINVATGTDRLRREKHKASRRHSTVRQQASLRPQITIQHESDDEFAIEDDSAFTTEMQDLAERYDAQDNTFSACATGPQAAQVHNLDSALDSNVQPTSVDDAYENDFDDDDLWDGIGNESFSHPRGTAVGSASQKIVNNRAIKRYLIVDVIESDYENAEGRRRPEKVRDFVPHLSCIVLYARPYFSPDNWSKLALVLTTFQILSVKDEKTRLLKLISLRQSWFDSRCTKGSYVHLIGDFDHAGQCIVDDADNMIILHPDHLISATVVADSFTCARRAVLQDRVKATGAAEKPQVYGHMLHEVFGEALKANEWSADRLKTVIEQVVSTYIEPLYEINVQVPEAVNHLMSKMPELSAWASLFISPRPTTEAVVQDRNGAIAFMSINKLIEVEEHIWSPMYGLKGNVDATVQVALQQPGESCARTLTVPLEFKTGRKDNNEMHRAQTQLYTLLMSDRYDLEVTTGVLYYLETAKTSRVEGIRHEIRHMIIQRNELACYVRDKLELPPMIKKPHMCKNCYAQTSCFVYHRLVEAGNGDTSGMKEIFDDATRHLQPTHEAFFKKWDDLLTKEERDAMKFRRELWTMLSSEREKLGRCFSDVIIEPGSAQEDVDSPKINRFQYTFIKHKATNKFSFTESQLTIGEPIVVSDEDGHFALANGYITNVRRSRVTVAVDRKLHNARQKEQGFGAETNQVFTGIMDLTKDRSLSATTLTPGLDNPILYRVDKDEFSNGMATARNNLIRLMESNLFRARELRKLIIEHQRPSFKPTSSAYSLLGPASQQDLNVDQRRAIDKVMSAKDYALVLGMPGTGKTTTIAHIIRALVSQGKSVLLASYTHTAVDNILLKIKDDNIPVFRLGAVGKVHPEVQSFAELGGIPKKTIEELENSYVNSKVVATTCLGINQPIFNARIFDYCIVDEASQITLPVCLGPIRMARTFILVGDHFQLPPLVQNKEAQEGGLDISLFKLLSEAQPDSVVNLEHQYRMAEDIMMLSNELIYSGRLKCGTPEVANRVMQIPNVDAGLAAHHHNASSLSTAAAATSICTSNSACWLRRSLSPKARCLFLNTDTLVTRAPETVSGSRITNPAEAILTSQLVTTLIRSGVSPRSIGVITFYRSQLALLRQELKMVAGATAGTEVEMHTADKFQGRDKEVVLLSCVRSNDTYNIGDLLKDWRRVNVAVTRARSKLIIIGSKQTLGSSQNEVVEGLVNLMDGKGWIYDLPTNALDDHAFENGSQASGRLRKEGQSTKSLAKGVPSQSLCKQGSFRKPRKTVHGSVDVEKLLEKRPVMKDIINGI